MGASSFATRPVCSRSTTSRMVSARVPAADFRRRRRRHLACGHRRIDKFFGRSIQTVRSDHGFPVSDLTAITEDDVHTLWIGTGFGLLPNIEARFRRGRRSPFGRCHFHCSVRDRSDGLAGLPHAYNNDRRVVRASDGRLWFVASRGLSVIDPRAFRESAPQPPMTVEYVTANETRVKAVTGLRLPARTTRLEIGYSELNLSSPLKTRFRHRLEGFDADWVNAGTLRTAFYTDLPRGNTSFRYWRVRQTARDRAWGVARLLDRADVLPDELVHCRCGHRQWAQRMGDLAAAFAQDSPAVCLATGRARAPESRAARHALAGNGRRRPSVRCHCCRRQTNAPGMQRHFVRMRKQVEE